MVQKDSDHINENMNIQKGLIGRLFYGNAFIHTHINMKQSHVLERKTAYI